MHSHGSDDPGEMRAVDEVRAGILANIRTLSSIELHLQEAWGCVLASDVVAESDVPAFPSSAMDGVAVRSVDLRHASPDAPVVLAVTETLPAGRVSRRTLGKGEAMRIMTGAMIPDGADAVIPVEEART